MEKQLTPIKAIRAKCLDCSCGNTAEVKRCPITKCPLYVYRMGKNPNRKMSDEAKRAAAERLKKFREENKT